MEGVGLAGGACTLPDVRGHPLVCRVFSAAQTGVTSIHGCTGPPCPDVGPHATPAKGLRRVRVTSPASKKGRGEKCGWRCSTSGLPVVRPRLSSSWSAPAHSHLSLTCVGVFVLHLFHLFSGCWCGNSRRLLLQYFLCGFCYGVACGPSLLRELGYFCCLGPALSLPHLFADLY
jgi:hypothetical protein